MLRMEQFMVAVNGITLVKDMTVINEYLFNFSNQILITAVCACVPIIIYYFRSNFGRTYFYSGLYLCRYSGRSCR